MRQVTKIPSSVILGGHYLALGAARNLADRGVHVYVLDNRTCVSQFSRSVNRFFKCSSTDEDVIELLLRLSSEANLRGAVLFASTDEYVRLLAQNRESLSEYYVVTTPSWDVTKYFYDKRLTHRLAQDQGVPVPETFYQVDEEDLGALKLDFPVVLKPGINTRFMSVTRKKAYRANDLDELVTLYRKMASVIDSEEILVQELIPGRGNNLYSFFGLFRDGRPVAGFSAKRSRQHPMEFGRASTFVETMNIPELGRLAIQLLDGLGYSGLAEVEFMYDPKHSRFELLEINPRIWGWHTIANRAGVNLPYLAYAEAIGQQIPVGSFREGVKWMRLITDIPTAISEIWAGRLSVAQYLKSLQGEKEFAMLSLRDPLPFVLELFLIPYYARTRGF